MPRKKKSKNKETDTLPELSHLDILDLFIALYRENGCPPPLSCVQEETGKGAFVRKAMKRLLDEGYVTQPYRGSYCPLKDSKGTPIAISVRIGSEERPPQQEISSPFQALGESISAIMEGMIGERSSASDNTNVEEQIQSFREEVGFHLEALDSKVRKLTETLGTLLVLPGEIEGLREEIEILRGDREVSRKLEEEIKSLSTWRNNMAKMFAG